MMATAVQLDLWTQESGDQRTRSEEVPRDGAPGEDCGWTRDVALDPRHRPQALDRPASTVRRDWWRAPQEAHLLDEANNRYRKLVWEEMAVLQGFDPAWFAAPGLTKTARISAIGDAVPPPLAAALLDAISMHWSWNSESAAEICAGAGGLASAAARGLEHLALIDHWDVACEILRTEKPWAPEAVVLGSVTDYDWRSLRGRIGLLSGGPPCQPWSQGGRRRGTEDPRDLLGRIHETVAVLEPEVILLENVPGLVSVEGGSYFRMILDRLRRPSPDLRYGVMAAIFNAADFGVPQLRRRLFFLGFRDKPLAFAHRVLDDAHSRRSHRAPTVADSSRPVWRTVGDALADRADPGGWRRWVGADEAPPAAATA
jgi:site-specific DNA-cytosine methylase